jgi:spore photoproduct lyase
MSVPRKEHNSESKRMKGQQAALKAWETIRQKQLKETLKKHRKIIEFMDMKALANIKHPEVINSQKGIESDWNGNGIVVPFHKTPPEIACGRFWELRWAYGCPLDCSYCYLRGTTRGNMRPRYVKVENVLVALDEAFKKISEPSIFNSGELCDSLMNPPIMSKICDRFEQQNKHKILLLSKFGPKNIGFLLNKLRKQVICMWSINAQDVARIWERAAPSPEDRIEAASLVREAGYDTRIRIDPIFPIENWRIHYEELLQHIVLIEPTRIILGTPRGLWKTIKYAKEAGADMSWTRFFKESSGWGKKLDFNERKEIYQFFYDELKSMGYTFSKITICKETTSMWKALGFPYTPLTCNCYGRDALEP